MHRVPITLSVLIIVAWIAISWFLISSNQLALTKPQLVEHLILLATASGAFISTAFVVWSYLQTNQAFVLSQKPALLLVVDNLKLARSNTNQEIVHGTQVIYRNTTSNSFYDLTIQLDVTVAHRSINLSDLFTARMYMAGYDERRRYFLTIDELASRGLDLNAITERGNEAILFLTILVHILKASAARPSSRI